MAESASEVIRKFVPGEGGFVFYRDGVKIAREWKDKTGQVQVEGEIPDGIIRTYYDDGTGSDSGRVFAEWQYKDGRLEGISRIYREDGSLDEEFNYLEGKIDRIMKFYYENGQVSCESILENPNGHLIYKEFPEETKQEYRLKLETVR